MNGSVHTRTEGVTTVHLAIEQREPCMFWHRWLRFVSGNWNRRVCLKCGEIELGLPVGYEEDAGLIGG